MIHSYRCPHCGCDHQMEYVHSNAKCERLTVAKSLLALNLRTLFGGGVTTTGHICKQCGELIWMGASAKLEARGLDSFRPVFLRLIPNPTTVYKVSGGAIEVHGLLGTLKGSVPLKGAHFSVVGAGLLNLGVGDIKIRGKNSEELILKNVFRAKAIRTELQRLESEA